MNITLIIVAGGSGSRFGGPLPKQFCDLDGRPVLMRTIDSCRGAVAGMRIILVLSPEMTDYWDMLCDTLQFESPEVVAGGATRFESVQRGLRRVERDCDVVMVHDGARPFPSRDIFRRLISAFDDPKCQGALPAIALSDSIRRLNPDGSSESVPRSSYRAVQTPQAFRAKLLIDANHRATAPAESYTDDASVMEAAGYRRLALVEGDSRNIKITNPGDLALAAYYLGSEK